MAQQELDLSINTEADEGAEDQHTEGDGKVCAHCSNPFTPKSAKAIYCSQRCRNAGNMKKRKLNGAPDQPTGSQPVKEEDDDRDDSMITSASSTKLHGSLRGLEAQSQYIITHQQGIINDLKAKRRDLEKKVETLTERATAAEKKLDRLDLEKELGIAEKSGLNGLSNNPLVQSIMNGIMPHAGPGIGKWLEQKLLGTPAEVPGMEGVEKLDEEAQANIKELNKWYAMQPKEVQDTFFTLIENLSHLKDEEIPGKLKQLNTLFTNGTPFKRTGTYGGF